MDAIEAEEEAFTVCLSVACSLKRGDDTQVHKGLACSAFHPSKLRGRGPVVLLVVSLLAIHSYG